MALDLGFPVAIRFREAGVLLFASPGGSWPEWFLVEVTIGAGFVPDESAGLLGALLSVECAGLPLPSMVSQ